MYKITKEEEVPMIKKGLGKEGLQLIQTFMNPRTVFHTA